MHRKKMANSHSKRVFKKGTRINKVNTMNPRRMRGGIRIA